MVTEVAVSRREANDHHAECARCHNDRMKRRTAKVRQLDLNELWQGINRNGALQRCPKVEALATAAINRFGGLDHLVRFWRKRPI
ncbi:MAG: hypothetical protein J5I93_21575 [Pirellulaceae bacterium]|nr:hypothetical protein [Pirellulaceae bacterium]